MSFQKGGGPNQSNNTSHNFSKKKGNHSRKAGWRSSRLPTARKDDFKGECEDLKGKIYIVGSAKQADNFNNKTEAIMEYFLREYTYGLDLWLFHWKTMKRKILLPACQSKTFLRVCPRIQKQAWSWHLMEK